MASVHEVIDVTSDDALLIGENQLIQLLGSQASLLTGRPMMQ